MGKNTLYLSVPWLKSLKTCETDYAFRRLACFLQPLAKYRLPMFLHFLSQTRDRGISCCHTALERFQHKNYLYSAMYKELQYHLTHVQQVLQHWLKVFWAESCMCRIAFALSFCSVPVHSSLSYLWSRFELQLDLFLFADICISFSSVHLLIVSADPFLYFASFCLFVVLFLADGPFAMTWISVLLR